MLEKQLEKSTCDRLTRLGVKAEKFTSPGRRSVPDRMLSLPRAKTIFVEFKAEGKTPTTLQDMDHAWRRAMGFEVWVVSNRTEADALVERVKDLLRVDAVVRRVNGPRSEQ